MSGTQEEDKKPDQGSHINLKIKEQDGNEVFFRIKRSNQLKELLNAYCDRRSLDFCAIVFLFNDRRIREDRETMTKIRAKRTPDELEMEDGDEILAMIHQNGA